MSRIILCEHVPVSCPSPASPSGHGLGELARMAVTGQLAGAELELHEWQRQADCPPAARVMLAGLLARRGQLTHATAVLRDVPDQPLNQLDPQEGRLLLTLYIATDQPGQARRLTRQLYDAFGDRPVIRHWLRRVESPGFAELPDEPATRIERLADELAAQPEVIPSLVTAQTYAPDPRRIALLRHALSRLAPTVRDGRAMLIVARAQARLSLLAHDHAEARRWAHRGLKQSPSDEKLALVLAAVEDDVTVGPPARDVLGRVAAAHPQYPDVRRALIRRHARDGQRQSARELLANWLQREPDSPIARALDQELAA